MEMPTYVTHLCMSAFPLRVRETDSKPCQRVTPRAPKSGLIFYFLFYFGFCCDSIWVYFCTCLCRESVWADHSCAYVYIYSCRPVVNTGLSLQCTTLPSYIFGRESLAEPGTQQPARLLASMPQESCCLRLPSAGIAGARPRYTVLHLVFIIAE